MFCGRDHDSGSGNGRGCGHQFKWSSTPTLEEEDQAAGGGMSDGTELDTTTPFFELDTSSSPTLGCST